jgi:hypothetical protein
MKQLYYKDKLTGEFHEIYYRLAIRCSIGIIGGNLDFFSHFLISNFYRLLLALTIKRGGRILCAAKLSLCLINSSVGIGSNTLLIIKPCSIRVLI